MAKKYASHAQALLTAQSSGSRAGTNRGDTALGNLVYIQSTYTVAGDEEVGDVIEWTGPIPEGLALVPALSQIVVESDPGTTFTMKFGSSTDDDAYSAAKALAATGASALSALRPVDHPASDKILGTLTAVDTLTADAVITAYFVFRSVS